MAITNLFVSLLALIPLCQGVRVIMSNPLFEKNPTQQIWNFVPPQTHCCTPLDLEVEGKDGWWRAESVTYTDLPAHAPTFIQSYGLRRGLTGCRGAPILSTSTKRETYQSKMFPPFAPLGGASYRTGHESDTSPPKETMYPDFIRHKSVFYELVHQQQGGRLTYQSLDGQQINGMALFQCKLGRLARTAERLLMKHSSEALEWNRSRSNFLKDVRPRVFGW